ncbi:MAG: peptide chain release factor N(5)-glutamine methyltransferase [Lewinellaceae bacterium]|nr:peptide chain release factor N(5)-glutamine methyltransferase [Lewinellaceae bacterium]
MTINTTRDARRYLIERLTPRYGAGEAASVTRIVFEDVFGLRNDAGANTFDPEQQVRFSNILERLLSGEPVQYVVGQADFFGMTFTVTPAVLIPRQETEELVAWALEFLKEYPSENPIVLDIGLGSGCIGIAMKKKNPRLRLLGVDKSAAALSVARQNAEKILGNEPFVFFECDILQPSNWAQFSPVDLIISNPPYIPESERSIVPEHVSKFEPELALFVKNEDPLIFYRTIADFGREKLRPSGALFFECNEFNAREVVELLLEKGFRRVELQKDLSGADRMVRAFRPD